MSKTAVAVLESAPRFPIGFAEGEGDGEGNQSGSGEPGAGSSGAGSEGAGGSPSGEGSLSADEAAQLEARRRALQSERDRLAARVSELEKQGQPSGAAAEGQPTPGLSAADVISLMRREREFTQAESTLREQFPYADAGIFQRSLDFDSVEALRQAAEESHNSVKARVEAAMKDREKEILKPYIERFGELQQTPPDSGGAPATGDPTPEQLRAMSPSELIELERANPGVIDRVKRSATGR